MNPLNSRMPIQMVELIIELYELQETMLKRKQLQKQSSLPGFANLIHTPPPSTPLQPISK